MDLSTLLTIDGPMRAGLVIWRPEPGRWTVTVCVKATFELAPLDLPLARNQEPLGSDMYWGGDSTASLWSASDFIPYKPRPEALLVGHAHAPLRQAPAQLVARVGLGDRTKSVTVFGERRFKMSDGGRQEVVSQPVSSVPLRYERGPRDERNPIGFDLDVTLADDTTDQAAQELLGQTMDREQTTLPIGGLAAPNLEPHDRGAPCFGPLSPGWRADRLGLDKEAREWVARFARAPGDAPVFVVDDPAPMGGPTEGGTATFPFRVFNAAPDELQLDSLDVGMPIVLENLNRKHPVLRTALPDLTPRVSRNGAEEHLVCDTLWIDLDHERVTLVWRAVVEVANPFEEQFLVLSNAERDEATLTLPPRARIATKAGSARAPLLMTQEIDPRSVRSPALPFDNALDLRRARGDGRAADEIGVRDYAFVVASIERGEVDRVLTTLGLRLAELMRIQQLWRRRLALDAALRAEVDQAIADERLQRERSPDGGG